MADSYRKLQYWNNWLSEEFLGNQLMVAEQQMLTSLLANHFGKHALLIGVPHQAPLLESVNPSCHSLIAPWIHRDSRANFIEANFYELPIFTGAIHLVLLPHLLEFVDNPRQVLAEACRVIQPEGLVAIFSFNRFRTWGAEQQTTQNTSWTCHPLPINQIKAWLRLLDFEIDQQHSFLYRPPLNHPALYQRLAFLEKIGNKFFPFLGGGHILIARAKVTPLTPIKLQWKQHLSSIGISSTISRPI